MKLRTNAGNLFKQSVLARVAPPVAAFPYEIGHDGIARILPSVGGITYNFTLGDRVFGRIGDHVEPDVSCRADQDDGNRALNLLSCIGNEGLVLSGRAENSAGIVIGKHSVINHVIVHFAYDVLDKLKVGDEIQFRAWGQGLALLDYPKIRIMNLAPDLVERMDLDQANGQIQVQVSAIIPPFLAGSGIGSNAAQLGDIDIMTADKETVKQFNLENLRIGDFVAVEDVSADWGAVYKKDAVTIGIIMHGDSNVSGHGPGITVIMSGDRTNIKPVIKDGSNLSLLFPRK